MMTVIFQKLNSYSQKQSWAENDFIKKLKTMHILVSIKIFIRPLIFHYQHLKTQIMKEKKVHVSFQLTESERKQITQKVA